MQLVVSMDSLVFSAIDGVITSSRVTYGKRNLLMKFSTKKLNSRERS